MDKATDRWTTTQTPRERDIKCTKRQTNGQRDMQMDNTTDKWTKRQTN